MKRPVCECVIERYHNTDDGRGNQLVTTIRNPLCPRHGMTEDDSLLDWWECIEAYDLAVTNSGQLIDADDYDPATGERRPA